MNTPIPIDDVTQSGEFAAGLPDATALARMANALFAALPAATAVGGERCLGARKCPAGARCGRELASSDVPRSLPVEGLAEQPKARAAPASDFYFLDYAGRSGSRC